MQDRTVSQINTLTRNAVLIGMMAVAILVAPGCASPGPKHAYGSARRPIEDLATIRGETRDAFLTITEGTFVERVDRAVLQTPLDWLKGRFPEVIYVTPGKHTLSVQRREDGRYATMDLWLIAEAGRTYLLKSAIKGYNVFFWLEDADSGLRVGGIKGSDDEPAESNAN